MPTLSSRIPFSARAQRTADSPISSLMRRAIEDPEVLSLAAGFVDQRTLPQDLLRGAVDGILGDPERARAALQYGSTLGLRDLRSVLATRLENHGLRNVDPDCLVISNGGQQSLYTLTEVLVDQGDVVLVEDPTYFVYMDVLRSAGARVMGVVTDREGMDPEALEQRFDELRARGLRDRLKVVYLMSYYSNPTGSNMSWKRRKAIHDAYLRELERGPWFLLLEDASYRDLYLDIEPEPFLKAADPGNENVFVCGTFSKAFAPGLRLGWSYMPPEIHRALVRQKGNQDFGSTNLNQTILARLLEGGAYDVAAARFRERYRAKRDALLAAIAEFWPSDVKLQHPQGGLYVWARLPGINTDPGSPFLEAVLREKVLYVPGLYCYCDETQNHRPNDAMRLCYGLIDMEPMREAVRRMGRVIAQMRGG